MQDINEIFESLKSTELIKVKQNKKQLRRVDTVFDIAVAWLQFGDKEDCMKVAERVVGETEDMLDEVRSIIETYEVGSFLEDDMPDPFKEIMDRLYLSEDIDVVDVFSKRYMYHCLSAYNTQALQFSMYIKQVKEANEAEETGEDGEAAED